MNAQVIIDGTDVSDYLISISRQINYCDIAQKFTVVLDSGYTTEILPYDDIEIYEEGTKVLTGYVSSIEKSGDTGTLIIEGLDIYKRAIDYFVSDLYTTSSGQTTGYWIDKLLDLCGLPVTFTSGSGVPVTPDMEIGLDTVDNLVTQFLQQSGWYGHVSPDGEISIGDMSFSHSDITISEGENLLSIETERSYDKTRNKILVFGRAMYGSGGLQLITATATQPLDFVPVDQTVVLANPYIASETDAQTIANSMLSILAKETYIKNITMLGDPSIQTGTYVDINSDIFTGTALVTSCYSSFDENGYLMTLTLDDICPRFVGYSNFLNFFDSPAMYAISENFLCRTRDLETYPYGGPFWEIIAEKADLTSGNLYDRFDGFILDPWDPKNKAYIWVYNDTIKSIQVYEVDNLNGPAGTQTYTKIYEPSPFCHHASVEASITVKGALFVNYINGGSTGYYGLVRRTSYGGTFDYTSFGIVGTGAWPFRELGCVAVGHHSGKVYVPHWYISLTPGTTPIRESNDFGNSWRIAYTPIPDNPFWLGSAVIPYMDETDTLLYFAAHRDDYPRSYQLVYRWDGSNLHQISPAYPTGGYHNIGGSRADADGYLEYVKASFRTGLWNYTYDKDIVRFVDGYYLLLSEDQGNTWERKNLPVNFLHGMGGWPFSPNIVLAWGYGGFQLSLDTGDTWINLEGDWKTVTGEDMRLIQAVPVWVP